MNGLLKQFIEQINNRCRKAVNRIQTTIQAVVLDRLTNSPEYISMTTPNEELYKQFGITDPDKVTRLMNRFALSVKVKHIPLRLVGRGISRKPILTIRSADTVQDLIDSPLSEASLTRKNIMLNVMDWLCIAGDKTIISDFHYTLPNRYELRHFSRSGGYMRKGGRWRVPPQFSGTEENNFVTHSLDNVDKEIEQIIKQAII